jgi:CRP/FNR family transcriptional regulator, cyclic AMP receptor protein
MRSRPVVKVTEACHRCAFCVERLFAGQPPETLRAFDVVKVAGLYPKGVTPFIEGQEPRGVYVLCAGRMKLSVGSRSGRSLIVRVAAPGEILGLSATLSGRPYHLTAEALEPVQADFVRREEFLHFLRSHPEVCLRVAEQLSGFLHAAHSRLGTLGGARAADARLAGLLLRWADEAGGQAGGAARLHLPLTHADIGQLIGASRETVTRLFADLRNGRIAELSRGALVIHDRAALAALARR